MFLTQHENLLVKFNVLNCALVFFFQRALPALNDQCPSKLLVSIPTYHRKLHVSVTAAASSSCPRCLPLPEPNWWARRASPSISKPSWPTTLNNMRCRSRQRSEEVNEVRSKQRSAFKPLTKSKPPISVQYRVNTYKIPDTWNLVVVLSHTLVGRTLV